jgi:hypothetical protein
VKFEKFVKSLASNGIIYNRLESDGLPFADHWLASTSVFMLIPPTIKSITAAGVQEMPKAIDHMISQIGHTEYAELTEAIMPIPDGGIKDCIRVFKTRAGDISIKISNDDWSLIEKSDLCEILYAYDIDSNSTIGKALLVKRYPELPDDDDELVGIIFPVPEN